MKSPPPLLLLFWLKKLKPLRHFFQSQIIQRSLLELNILKEYQSNDTINHINIYNRLKGEFAQFDFDEEDLKDLAKESQKYTGAYIWNASLAINDKCGNGSFTDQQIGDFIISMFGMSIADREKLRENVFKR